MKIGININNIEIHSKKKPAIKIIIKNANRRAHGDRLNEFTKSFIKDIPPVAAKTPVNKLPAININIIIEVTVIVFINASLNVLIENFL